MALSKKDVRILQVFVERFGYPNLYENEIVLDLLEERTISLAEERSWKADLNTLETLLREKELVDFHVGDEAGGYQAGDSFLTIFFQGEALDWFRYAEPV